MYGVFPSFTIFEVVLEQLQYSRRKKSTDRKTARPLLADRKSQHRQIQIPALSDASYLTLVSYLRSSVSPSELLGLCIDISGLL